MEYVIKGRKPASVFRFFEEISAIPRASYHEAAVADYLERFAMERGLFCYRDAQNNVLIKAPATRGREDAPPILLQGHTDMVCEKNADVEHDFSRDPLRLWVDGNLLRAKGTTLGADNGIAVAIMLALLDGEVGEHPAYECLFTTAEEVGLDGAREFDYSRIAAKRLINLDSEALGKVTCGCAGGVRSDLTLAYTPEVCSGETLRISIKGLMGGHSGENINCGRANANKLMGRLLAGLLQKTDLQIASIEGGSKDNAIPRECEAVISVADSDQASDILTVLAEEICSELCSDDAGCTITVEDTETPDAVLSLADSIRAIAVLATPANGVLEMSRDVAGLVEYSRNLGVVRTGDGEMIFTFSARSSMESRIDATEAEMELLGRMTACTVEHRGRYPGWSWAPTSPLRDAYAAAYREVTGKEAEVGAIHAGLECGIIFANCPEMDIISIGPSLCDIHSPAESMDLDDAEIFWDTLAELIRRL